MSSALQIYKANFPKSNKKIENNNGIYVVGIV